MDHLVEYYVQARPLGFWGPVRREALRRGLIADSPPGRKPWFSRDWTPAEADAWTRHDAGAAALSAACYLLVAVGVAGALLLRVWGFIALAASAICAWVMFRMIDPKLRALSAAFEANQARHLARVERATRWEETP